VRPHAGKRAPVAAETRPKSADPEEDSLHLDDITATPRNRTPSSAKGTDRQGGPALKGTEASFRETILRPRRAVRRIAEQGWPAVSRRCNARSPRAPHDHRPRTRNGRPREIEIKTDNEEDAVVQ
jgi:hypothetical protein